MKTGNKIQERRKQSWRGSELVKGTCCSPKRHVLTFLGPTWRFTTVCNSSFLGFKVVMTSLYQFDTHYNHPRGGDPNWENASTRSGCKQTSLQGIFLVLNGSGSTSSLGTQHGTPLGWSAWVLYDSRLSKLKEQASKQHYSMALALAPASRFLPYLSSCLSFPQWTVSQDI